MVVVVMRTQGMPISRIFFPSSSFTIPSPSFSFSSLHFHSFLSSLLLFALLSSFHFSYLSFSLVCFALLCSPLLALLCFAVLLCSVLFCFALLRFALPCFALLCSALLLLCSLLTFSWVIIESILGDSNVNLLKWLWDPIHVALWKISGEKKNSFQESHIMSFMVPATGRNSLSTVKEARLSNCLMHCECHHIIPLLQIFNYIL